MHFFHNTLWIKEYNTTILVGDHHGADIDTEVLAMGMVIPGGSSNARDLILTNDYDFPVKVTLIKEGDMKDWLRMPSSVTIPPNSTESIGVSAHVPLGVPFGEYEGKLRAIFTRA